MLVKGKNGFNIYQIVVIALMAALVYVGSSLSFPVSFIGGVSRIHIGNTFCLLAGLICGPVGGGLAAGIGSFLYDLIMYPDYLPDSPFTFCFKFLLAFVCAVIAYDGHSEGKKTVRNIIACVAGSLTYIVLYVGKGFVVDFFVKGYEINVSLLNVGTKLLTSSVNGVIAVVLAVPFFAAIRYALDAAKLGDKLYR